MLTKRIVPGLDVKEGRVVKGTRFLDLKDAGDPVEVAKEYEGKPGRFHFSLVNKGLI